jgi:hypothetical protein
MGITGVYEQVFASSICDVQGYGGGMPAPRPGLQARGSRRTPAARRKATASAPAQATIVSQAGPSGVSSRTFLLSVTGG